MIIFFLSKLLYCDLALIFFNEYAVVNDYVLLYKNMLLKFECI